MSLAEQLSSEIVPCSEASKCLNSPEHNPSFAKCMHCRLAEAGGGTGKYWKPWDGRSRHPKLDQIKRQEAHDKRIASATKRLGKDRGKKRLLKQAERAERQTEQEIIRATKNSGRANQDGDHVSFGKITLDTKLQTKVVNPKIQLKELDKVREDATRAGNPFGALVVRNKYGRAVVVFDEEDYARLMSSYETALTLAAVRVVEARNRQEERAEELIHVPAEDVNA